MDLDNKKKYLITGGTGFLGTALIQRLVDMGIRNLVVLARNEGKLVELKEKYPTIEIVPGSVADFYSCEKACLGVDGIFHLAALKHVGMAETNVRETIVSNIKGSMNLLDMSRQNTPKFIIGISTDKAASRKGVYGVTKFLMEKLFAEYEKVNPKTMYRTVRYGNVLYSTGSVLTKWKEKLMKNEVVTITDEDATRFFWTVDQAVDLIFECLDKATDSTPYLTKMKSMRMGDLLNAMQVKYSPPGKMAVSVAIGLQPGENMHEIIAEGQPDSSQVERFTHAEIMEMI